MRTHRVKYEVHKMATLLGITRGSNLNLRWGNCGVWSIDQWVPTSLCASVCLTVDYTLRILNIIILDACLVIIFVWDIDMLIILIDHFDYPHILTLLAIWLLCSPWHVHSSCCLSHSSWHDCVDPPFCPPSTCLIRYLFSTLQQFPGSPLLLV